MPPLLPLPAAAGPAAPVYVLAFESGLVGVGVGEGEDEDEGKAEGAAPTQVRKLLLVNKRSTPQRVDVAGPLRGAASTAHVVDATYRTQPSPRVEAVAAGEALTLPAFATAVVVGSTVTSGG